MSRPREHDDRIAMGLRIEPELYKMLKVAAAERDVAANWLINKALADYLPRLLPVGEVRWTRDA